MKPIQIPEDLMFLITEQWRYKVAYSGRYGYKSWSFALAIISLCMQRKIRVLCCREIQKSIKDSVHQLLSDRIEYLELQNEFEIMNTEIINKKTGSRIFFDGLRDSTIDIKSKEGIDICWVEEAEALTKASFDKLYPTIRKDNSEIWFSFNTTNEDAFIYQYFVVSPPDDAKVVRTFWWKNPFINETIRKAALDCKMRDPEGYDHIWEGNPSSKGAKVYSNFFEQTHVKQFSLVDLSKAGNFYVGMDPHKTAYPATLFGCKIPTNMSQTEFDYVIYNEFPSKSVLDGKYYHEVRLSAKCKYTQKQLSGMFYSLERTLGAEQVKNIEIKVRACDPYFAKGVGGGDWSSNTDGLVAEWAKPENGGLYWTLPAPSVLSIQRNTINELLMYNMDLPVSSINSPRLWITPNCQNLINTMKYHRDSSEKDIEDETYKDFSDALRILCSVMVNNSYSDPKKQGFNEPVLNIMDQCKNLFFKTSLRG